MQSLVLVGVDGDDHVDVGPGPSGRVDTVAMGRHGAEQEREHDDETHADSVESGPTSHKLACRPPFVLG
jgi:hypothetical protein